MSDHNGAAAYSPAIASQWRTINPAHAIQRAAVVLTFSEELTSVLLRRVVDAVRAQASGIGLTKEVPINQALFQITPGAAIEAQPATQSGTAFQRMQGDNVLEALSVTTEAVRFETNTYTRWVAFKEQFEPFLRAVMPLIALASQVKSLALEYNDFFYAVHEGSADVQLIVDRQSPFIVKKAYSRRSPFHSHAGWFENETGASRKLVNVDLSVTDANGPMGVRRAIMIRTHEAETIIDFMSERAAQLLDTDIAVQLLDTLHVSLKRRLRDVLTRDCAAMISLGH